MIPHPHLFDKKIFRVSGRGEERRKSTDGQNHLHGRLRFPRTLTPAKIGTPLSRSKIPTLNLQTLRDIKSDKQYNHPKTCTDISHLVTSLQNYKIPISPFCPEFFLIFTINFKKEIKLTTYPVFFLRSVLGYQLRKLCCMSTHSVCGKFLYSQKCMYSQIFESIIPKDNAVLYNRNRYSHPYTLFIDETLESNAHYKTFRFYLISMLSISLWGGVYAL